MSQLVEDSGTNNSSSLLAVETVKPPLAKSLEMYTLLYTKAPAIENSNDCIEKSTGSAAARASGCSELLGETRVPTQTGWQYDSVPTLISSDMSPKNVDATLQG